MESDLNLGKSSRTPCYGYCPVYKVTILSDGTVRYFGEYFVEKEGNHTWQIDENEIDELNKAISTYGYFDIKAREEKEIERITCLPMCVASVLIEDGTYREIENYYGSKKYPEKLHRFEKRIDEIVGIADYVGSRFSLWKIGLIHNVWFV